MPLVRFHTQSSEPTVGICVGDGVVPVADITDHSPGDGVNQCLADLDSIEATVRDRLDDDPESVQTYDVAEVTLLRPVNPPKIARLEGCYEHDVTDTGFNPFIEPDGLNEMEWPSLWSAPLSSSLAPNEPIELPQFAKTVRPGVELAFVVGEGGKYLSSEDALDSIAGCLVAGDVAIYDDLPGLEGYKFFDSALPLGSQVVSLSELDVANLDVSVSVDGDVLDENSTSNWRFSPEELVASVSELMTLRPGDLVVTGDPMRIDRPLRDGDELTIEIGGVETVRKSVTRENADVEVRL
jgi:acylpyruvate hydrolase